MLLDLLERLGNQPRHAGGLDLVGLGQDDLVGDGCLVKQRQHVLIVLLDAVA
ncbi:hypothetical protein D3C72_2528230 [compost metagenome]